MQRLMYPTLCITLCGTHLVPLLQYSGFKGLGNATNLKDTILHAWTQMQTQQNYGQNAFRNIRIVMESRTAR